MPEFDIDAALTAKAEEPVAPPFPADQVLRWFPDSVLWNWRVDWHAGNGEHRAYALLGQTLLSPRQSRQSAQWECVAIYDPVTGVWG